MSALQIILLIMTYSLLGAPVGIKWAATADLNSFLRSDGRNPMASLDEKSFAYIIGTLFWPVAIGPVIAYSVNTKRAAPAMMQELRDEAVDRYKETMEREAREIEYQIDRESENRTYARDSALRKAEMDMRKSPYGQQAKNIGKDLKGGW